VSAAVAWEIATKIALGKLDSLDDLEEMMDSNRFISSPVTIPHALAVLALCNDHRDPFDRMLFGQALHEGFRLVTRN
jgi:PIN domain nuclease of toxin-antitoxin system